MLSIPNSLKTSPKFQKPITLSPIIQLINLKFFSKKNLASAAMSSSKMVAEYAKSSRSSCKKCSKSISSNSLRLGLVSKDPRGFDMTKWHHLSCFPFTNSNSILSTDAITGFSSLKSTDQESLKKLVNQVSQASEKDNTDEKEDTDIGQGNLKKQKLSASEEGGKLEMEIVISASDIKDNYKVRTLMNISVSESIVLFIFLLLQDDGLQDSEKIAAFDFDGCLAKTSVRKVGADAWSLMYPSIPEKLQSLYNDGYKLVIFTNEMNIERWKNKRQAAVDSKIGRLESFIKLVKVPIQVFIACGLSSGEPEDPFRKPKPGMWRVMEKEFNSGLPIDMNQSFYVGDAAGRPDDHSDADIKFAQTIGLKFYVPEEYFISSDQ
ncbi:hypothetical protein RD792_007260 [Penstemon davidsonii]|uniref:PARP-type domain-containing protein n=1 Tax=Penstemon davidsonii TaxID=160366 RepID=A0ABR0D6X5_9LAMI|nr:hypothetical protein RD792_007260 [Penstemon davidsonii]